ncbi:MAG: glycerol-3-phosphate 1-O-acyltransferase PlsY [Chloroflexia bacterium]|nr:glycerol-3-phosphate 1-O-acyltransferase PlsY [Chloroflexia bacterium]
MTDTAVAILLVVLGYASGAVPWGVVLGRWIGQVDLRTQGSQSIGATNALRLLGWRVSLAVFLLDFLKGFLPVVIARLLGVDGWWVAAVGVAAVIGHCWSPLIGFRGGKGMATGAGSAAGMFPWVLLVFPLMVLIVALTRYVSLASLVGSIAVSIVLVILGALGFVTWSVALAVVAITAIIVSKHEGNIRRLLSGTERRFGEPAAH